MTQHAPDDGFHEIQLNGKQLVFVFMAATVVSVVIFLCGVLVGRGVRGEQPDTAQVTTESADQQLRGAINPEKPPTVQQNEDPTKVPPPAPAEGGTSGDAAGVGDAVPVVTAGAATIVAKSAATAPETAARAADAKASATAVPATPAISVPAKPETAVPAKPAPPAARPETAVASKPAARETAPAAAVPDRETASRAAVADRETTTRTAVPPPDDTQRGWVVQVAATKTRPEADAIAKRLNSRGYSAFVSSNQANAFRVRVGGYKNKKDADGVAARLKNEERVTPWVTR